MINLYISIYPLSDQNRQEEIIHCLRKNISNSSIDQIIVLNEGVQYSILQSSKIKNVLLEKRPLFSDFFKYLENDSINIISNNDIIFPPDLKKIKYLRLRNADALSLTRYEPNGALIRSVEADSQDVWIFRGKPRCLQNADFYMGIPGCDSRLNFIFYEGGYRVLNPSKFIRCLHTHHTEKRNYVESDRIKGVYLLLKPIGFMEYYIFRILLYCIRRNLVNHFLYIK